MSENKSANEIIDTLQYQIVDSFQIQTRSNDVLDTRCGLLFQKGWPWLLDPLGPFRLQPFRYDDVDLHHARTSLQLAALFDETARPYVLRIPSLFRTHLQSRDGI